MCPLPCTNYTSIGLAFKKKKENTVSALRPFLPTGIKGILPSQRYVKKGEMNEKQEADRVKQNKMR